MASFSFFTTVGLVALTIYFAIVSQRQHDSDVMPDFQKLRELYSRPPLEWPKANVDDPINHAELGALPNVLFPENNPFSIEKARLGQKLFNDGRLSRSGQIACASCHDPDLGWSDGRKRSFGHNRALGLRNSPGLENIAFNASFFWDGRASTLEEQSLMPITDPFEQAFSLDELEQRLSHSNDYPAEFSIAFGDDKITRERIAMALATFQRTLVSGKSAFDWFLHSHHENDKVRKRQLNRRLSDKALWGLHLFRTKARCINCHNGSNFSDSKFHNIGLTYFRGELEDYGKYQHSGIESDKGKFKTPSLRGVFNTKPWMHNGQFFDMQGIIKIYNAGGVRTMDHDNKYLPEASSLLKPLGLNDAEEDALVAFLKAITAPPVKPDFNSIKPTAIVANTTL
ncbi:MAG: cytochrome c peroxidase [Pseudomonadota bacterium]